VSCRFRGPAVRFGRERFDDAPNMAIFCDFENVAIGVRDAKYDDFDIHIVLERLLDKGKIVVKKAYADWERYKSAKRAMHEASFEMIEIPHVSYSGKNSADIRLVVDALDLCWAKQHVDVFVIISGDSDFSPLVSKLRENAKRVIGLGVKNSSSDLLIENCDEFIYYDDLVRAKRDSKTKPKASRPAKAPAAKGDAEKKHGRTSEAAKPAAGVAATPTSAPGATRARRPPSNVRSRRSTWCSTSSRRCSRTAKARSGARWSSKPSSAAPELLGALPRIPHVQRPARGRGAARPARRARGRQVRRLPDHGVRARTPEARMSSWARALCLTALLLTGRAALAAEPAPEPKLLETSSLVLEVDSRGAAPKVVQAARAVGGRELSVGEDQAVVDVPAAEHRRFIERLTKIGRVRGLRRSTEDLTKQHARARRRRAREGPAGSGSSSCPRGRCWSARSSPSSARSGA